MVCGPANAPLVNDLAAAVPLGRHPEAAVAGLALLGAAGLVPVSARPARGVQSTVYTKRHDSLELHGLF